MKVRAIKRYVDKYTKETVEVSDKVIEVKDERAKELLEAGVVEEAEIKTTEKAVKTAKAE